MDIVLKDGIITSIKSVQPDPQGARPILREAAEELVRGLNYWGKASGMMRIKITYKLNEPSHSNYTKIAINPISNEITIEANQLLSD